MTALSPLLRRAFIVLAVAVVGLGSAACQPQQQPQRTVSASQVSVSDGSQLISMINGFRAAHGLGALSETSNADTKAQQHAQDMAAQDRLFHSASLSSGIDAGWSALGENVGEGSSISQVESMFESSGPHRANLLSGSFDQVGVGVARSSSGSVFVTEFFVGR